MNEVKERERFEQMFLRPPHIARMLERAGVYTGAMCNADRDFILERSLALYSENWKQVSTANDVAHVWESCLKRAVFTRPKWQVWWGMVEWRWVKSKDLGRTQ